MQIILKKIKKIGNTPIISKTTPQKDDDTEMEKASNTKKKQLI